MSCLVFGYGNKIQHSLHWSFHFSMKVLLYSEYVRVQELFAVLSLSLACSVRLLLIKAEVLITCRQHLKLMSIRGGEKMSSVHWFSSLGNL